MVLHMSNSSEKIHKCFLWKADIKEKYGTCFTNLKQICTETTIFSKYFLCNADNKRNIPHCAQMNKFTKGEASSVF